MTAPTTLATKDDFNGTPYAELVADYDPEGPEIDNLIARASRAVESDCDHRLVPFAGLVETHRAIAISQDDTLVTLAPVEMTAALAQSRARSLLSETQARQFHVREYPQRYQGSWAGAITDMQITRPLTTPTQVDVPLTQIEYVQDTGFVRFAIGVWIPRGSSVTVTYSGGYDPIPEDLVEACLLKAALLGMARLMPQAEQPSLGYLRNEYQSRIAPYIRRGM